MAADVFLILSAVLVAGLGAFHSVLGERYLVRRLLRRDDLPHLFGDDTFTKLTIRYAWHLLTIFCLAAAALFAYEATQARPSVPVVTILAATLGAAGLWGLVSTSARHWSWLVLLFAAASAGAGILL
ncbi:MAG: hypothetical protein HYT80_01985 [Euryarchaeota archaeon]|nr:hypothetical protein [Euryarchaeota archaeon]